MKLNNNCDTHDVV